MPHPHPLAHGMVLKLKLEHPESDTKPAIGCPIQFYATPIDITSPTSLPAQDTRELPNEFSLNEEEIDGLLACGAVAQAS